MYANQQAQGSISGLTRSIGSGGGDIPESISSLRAAVEILSSDMSTLMDRLNPAMRQVPMPTLGESKPPISHCIFSEQIRAIEEVVHGVRSRVQYALENAQV